MLKNRFIRETSLFWIYIKLAEPELLFLKDVIPKYCILV